MQYVNFILKDPRVLKILLFNYAYVYIYVYACEYEDLWA